MPTAIQGTATRQPQGRPQATYTVKSGDTLSAIAAKALGNPNRWSEIYALNRDLIGSNPGMIRAGMVLKMPASAVTQPAPAQPGPTKPATPPATTPNPLPSNSRQDSDRDGLIDRYDAAPRDPNARRWNQTAANEFAAYVDTQTQVLRKAGIEIDCADFAAKLLKDFCAAKGIPNPMEGKGTWHQYTPGNSGGLPNVNGPTYHLAGIHADNLAKQFTQRINDADGDGIRGFDATGKVDVDDLRPGDILFYDWDGNGVVNHTVNVVGIADDGTVTLAYGTYDNLRPGQPLTWENLDFLPVQRLELKPGTEDYEKWLGANNGLYGAHRYNWMPDHTVTRNAAPAEAPAAAPAPKPAAKPQAPQAPAQTAPVAPATPAEAPQRTPGRWENLMRILMSA
ncbi:LysM domain/BON superfamily protein [compost metagenome]